MSDQWSKDYSVACHENKEEIAKNVQDSKLTMDKGRAMSGG